MKKMILLLLLCSTLFNSMAQTKLTERKLKIKELPNDMLQLTGKAAAPMLNCACDGNLFKDGSFRTVLTGPGSDVSSSSPVWKPASYSPQYSRLYGGCDSGFVYMWGNQAVGESLSQSGLRLEKGKCYTIKFNARFPNNTGSNNPYVQLAIKGSTGGIATRGIPDVVSANITSTNWASYSINFTPSANFTALTLFPVNGNNVDDGAYVSWIQLDNVCLIECCDCGTWRGFTYQLTAPQIKTSDTLPSEKEGRNLKCGSTIVVKAGSTLQMRPNYSCTGGNCQAKFKTAIHLPNGKVQYQSGSLISLTPDTPGYYILSVTPECNGKACPPCRIRVLVVPGCEGEVFYEKGDWETAVLAGEGRG